jgi:hypothetical protein
MHALCDWPAREILKEENMKGYVKSKLACGKGLGKEEEHRRIGKESFGSGQQWRSRMKYRIPIVYGGIFY